ncbi:DUF6474 family protein [Corynebacterium glucuronolyticum]|uniref:DUF6474 family protein n=1 Tax=Corynebacterium glucuronolyticum TaxID=39791 RepID=UPI00019C1C1D|nr:DUF6474 family protein [Corynebacterium glucuronolyticum]EEI26299.1 hypothetical protein HMPREF0294_2192 [Corynebacterium glucuronolyticum ATCC 51867]QRO82249.1 hypothetical protein I6J20_10400 [Corynebacterium glucuronolyticum]
MGLFGAIRKARAKTKAEIKAAEARAKADSKNELKLNKLLMKHEKNLAKHNAKLEKKRFKEDTKLAKQELAKIRAGRFNKDTVNRYAGALRALAPLAIPLIYRAVTQWREQNTNRQASQLGFSGADLASRGGHGAPLKVRMDKLRSVEGLPTGFKKDVDARLDELEQAVDNAEHMTPEQRRATHRSIGNDLDLIASQIDEKLRA